MSTYSVKEVFFSLQGEGMQSGRAAVFCRFSGCNLWNGLTRDKSQSPCPFCDTDFVGVDGQNGGKFTSAKALATHIASFWPAPGNGIPYVVFSGGEPLLQLDQELIAQMHQLGFEVAVETNGSLPAPGGIDWLCVSPKRDMTLKITQANELKLLYPQTGIDPQDYIDLEVQYFFLQPVCDQNFAHNQHQTLTYCLTHPQWRYSAQLHKILQID